MRNLLITAGWWLYAIALGAVAAPVVDLACSVVWFGVRS